MVNLVQVKDNSFRLELTQRPKARVDAQPVAEVLALPVIFWIRSMNRIFCNPSFSGDRLAVLI